MDKNLTLTIDEDLLRAARRVAVDRNTSVSRMVCKYLAETVRAAELDHLFRSTRGKVGKISWTRDELHEQ